MLRFLQNVSRQSVSHIMLNSLYSRFQNVIFAYPKTTGDKAINHSCISPKKLLYNQRFIDHLN